MAKKIIRYSHMTNSKIFVFVAGCLTTLVIVSVVAAAIQLSSPVPSTVVASSEQVLLEPNIQAEYECPEVVVRDVYRSKPKANVTKPVKTSLSCGDECVKNLFVSLMANEQMSDEQQELIFDNLSIYASMISNDGQLKIQFIEQMVNAQSGNNYFLLEDIARSLGSEDGLEVALALLERGNEETRSSAVSLLSSQDLEGQPLPNEIDSMLWSESNPAVLGDLVELFGQYPKKLINPTSLQRIEAFAKAHSNPDVQSLAKTALVRINASNSGDFFATTDTIFKTFDAQLQSDDSEQKLSALSDVTNLLDSDYRPKSSYNDRTSDKSVYQQLLKVANNVDEDLLVRYEAMNLLNQYFSSE